MAAPSAADGSRIGIRDSEPRDGDGCDHPDEAEPTVQCHDRDDEQHDADHHCHDIAALPVPDLLPAAALRRGDQDRPLGACTAHASIPPQPGRGRTGGFGARTRGHEACARLLTPAPPPPFGGVPRGGNEPVGGVLQVHPHSPRNGPPRDGHVRPNPVLCLVRAGRSG